MKIFLFPQKNKTKQKKQQRKYVRITTESLFNIGYIIKYTKK